MGEALLREAILSILVEQEGVRTDDMRSRGLRIGGEAPQSEWVHSLLETGHLNGVHFFSTTTHAEQVCVQGTAQVSTHRMWCRVERVDDSARQVHHAAIGRQLQNPASCCEKICARCVFQSSTALNLYSRTWLQKGLTYAASSGKGVWGLDIVARRPRRGRRAKREHS